MFFRRLLNDETACASYLLGCKSRSAFAVVDPHVDLVNVYVALAETQDVPIVAVFETHVHADHVVWLPTLRTRRMSPGGANPLTSRVAFTVLPASTRHAPSSSSVNSSSCSTPWMTANAPQVT